MCFYARDQVGVCHRRSVGVCRRGCRGTQTLLAVCSTSPCPLCQGQPCDDVHYSCTPPVPCSRGRRQSIIFFRARACVGQSVRARDDVDHDSSRTGPRADGREKKCTLSCRRVFPPVTRRSYHVFMMFMYSIIIRDRLGSVCTAIDADPDREWSRGLPHTGGEGEKTIRAPTPKQKPHSPRQSISKSFKLTYTIHIRPRRRSYTHHRVRVCYRPISLLLRSCLHPKKAARFPSLPCAFPLSNVRKQSGVVRGNPCERVRHRELGRGKGGHIRVCPGLCRRRDRRAARRTTLRLARVARPRID